MPGDWQHEQFGMLLTGPVRNGIYKSKEFHGQGTKVVNMGELFAYPRLNSVPMKRVLLSNTEAERFSVRKGDLLFARRSLIAEGAGKCCVVLDVDEPTTFESSIIRARPDPSKANSLFLFYFFNSIAGLHALDTIRRHVAVAGITGTDLVRLDVPVPRIDEQISIAHILGKLDDKIELNRRMNETLEATARAIFKSWFVDFDPVRAKTDGRKPASMDAATADLFPSSFEDSSLGMIPEGWKVRRLEDVLDTLETGSRPKGGVGSITHGVPSVGAESIVGIGKFNYAKTKFVPVEFHQRMTKGKVQNRDVLLYKDGGRPGEYEPHVSMFGDGFPFAEFCINEHVYRLRGNNQVCQAFLFYWLTSDRLMEEMRVKGTGVAIPGLNSTSVKSLAALTPPVKVVHAFDKMTAPFLSRLFSNCIESRMLANTGNALLPKLLSGEIRVKDAEKYVGSVA